MFAVVCTAAPIFAYAETNTDTGSMQTQIQQLTAEVQKLKAEIAFTKSLFLGSSGGDVEALQLFLASDPSVYPEGLVTGYFGFKTQEALKRFQKKHGIEALGVLGPKTRSKINGFFYVPGTSTPAWMATTSGTTTAFHPFKLIKKIKEHGRDDDHDDDDDDDGDDHRGKKDKKERFNSITICHIQLGTGVKNTITVGAPAIFAHLMHNDTVGVCSGTVTTTPPVADTTAPVISEVTVGNIANTNVNIGWKTNELADGRVWFGTTTPLAVGSTAQSVQHANVLKNHSLSLTALVPSTTYYFLMVSKDTEGNTATSSQYSFSTAAN
jgi:hypothetical protein